MTPARTPRLGVECVEDRLLPSAFSFYRPPIWAAAWAAHADDDSRGRHQDRDERSDGYRGHPVSFQLRDERPAGLRAHAVSIEEHDEPSRPAPRSLSIGAIVVILPPLREPVGFVLQRAQVADDRSDTPAKRVTRETPASEPVAVRADVPVPRVAAATSAAGVSFAAPVEPPDAAVAPEAIATAAVVRPTADAPAATPPGPAAAARQDFVFLGTALPTAEAPIAPPGDVATPSEPTVEVAPTPVPALVERVIEAILPTVDPLAGLVPIDVTAVQAGAAVLFASLPDVGLDAGDDWSSPERWAWLTGAILVVGGAAYAARAPRNHRRADPAPPGTASALAHWESRHAANRTD